MADRDVTFDLLATDKTGRAVRSATRNFERLKSKVDDSSKANDDGSKSAGKFATRMAAMAKAAGKVAATAAAAASAVGPLVSGMLAGAKAAAALGKSVASLAPLAAFLPGLAGSAALLVGTLKLAGPGLLKALTPVTSAFLDADGKAGALTRRLQNLIGVGVEPLARQFAKVNLPVIAGGMERITVATNGVVRATGGWLNGVDGQRLIATITESTASSMERLAPKVSATAVAFGRLATRAGDPAITGLADLIGRVLDKLKAWADNQSIADINAALKDLSGYGMKARDALTAIQDIGRWMGENQGKVKAFSDVVAGAAIAIGLASGNIPAVAGGAFSLALNHWTELKSALTGAPGFFSDVFGRIKNDPSVQGIMDGARKSFQQFKDGFESATRDLGPKWTQFVNALKVAWDNWGPVISAWWHGVGQPLFNIIGQALGVFVTGFISGLTKLTIAWAAVGAAFRAIVPIVLNVFGTIINAAASAFGWVPGIGPKLKSAAAEFNAFRDQVNRALNGIDPIKTVRINASVYVTGGGAAGQSDQRTGNSRQAGFDAMSSWRPAQVAAAMFGSGQRFAMTGGHSEGRATTGGPAEVSVRNVIELDGRPFRDWTDRTIKASEDRMSWRMKVGRR